MKKKVLITGGSGLLAVNWALSLRNSCTVILLLNHRKISIDGIESEFASLDSIDSCQSIIEKNAPDIVIHTAGIANIEACEQFPEIAKKVNIDIAFNIAKVCNNLDIKLVHISTDHFAMGNTSFSKETDQVKPINIYAQTKYMGELKVIECCKNALIIRTNFFGWGTKYRRSFSDFILNKLRRNKSVELFKDVFFTPILIDELANIVSQLVQIDANGIYNIVGNQRLSKFEFGLKIAKCFDLNTKLILGINIDSKSNLITRPKDMSLLNAKVTKKLKTEIISIDDQLQKLMNQEQLGQHTYNQVNSEIIPYGRHYIDHKDIDAVSEVLRNGLLTQGPKVFEFEKKIATYVGSKYAVAVSNGTAALHLASLVLNLSDGDEVITTPNTFVATSNSILYVGAKPVFADIDSKTLNIDINDLENLIVNKNNVKAIYPVHFAGSPCDMEAIKKLADKYKLFIVEDASHALGALYKNGHKVGNCEYSEMTTFSFHPVKGIAAGEGGVITTNNRKIYLQLLKLRSHGITKGNFEFPGISFLDDALENIDDASENGKIKRWYYEMQSLGYNYRITDFQCALAISQMDKIDLFLSRRRELASRYDCAFERLENVQPLQISTRKQSSHHIYTININFKNLNLSKNQFMERLAQKGVGSQVHYIPVIQHPYYKSLDYDDSKIPKTIEHYKNTLSIPMYFGLNNDEQDLIIDSIEDLVG